MITALVSFDDVEANRTEEISFAVAAPDPIAMLLADKHSSATRQAPAPAAVQEYLALSALQTALRLRPAKARS